MVSEHRSKPVETARVQRTAEKLTISVAANTALCSRQLVKIGQTLPQVTYVIKVFRTKGFCLGIASAHVDQMDQIRVRRVRLGISYFSGWKFQ